MSTAPKRWAQNSTKRSHGTVVGGRTTGRPAAYSHVPAISSACKPAQAPSSFRMKVVDANGESQMDEEQWEAASKFFLKIKNLWILNKMIDIYIAFAFEKR